MHFRQLIIAIFTLYPNLSLADDIKKLFYEKDLSEHCKRRVIPSIFLGRHVVEASAFILHFTRLELPYSCFISVRSESGSNMIMVIQMEPGAGLVRSCSYHSPQLLVYEMGETFGGYWGPFPESMIKQDPPGTKIYTQRTTHPTTISIETTTTEKPTTTSATTPEPDGSLEEDFIRVEVPIVKVSGQLLPGEQQPTQAFDFDQAFDLEYDVTPIPGEKYDTSILPLVQLSVRKQPDDSRREGQEPLFDLDVIEKFTPDSRLSLPRYTPPSKEFNQKQKTNANKRLRFGKGRTTKGQSYKKNKIPSTRSTSRIRNKLTKYSFPTTTRSVKKGTIKHVRDSWEMIDTLMAKLNKNNVHNIQEENVKISHAKMDGENTSRIMENISNMKHNFSIYLAPNLSIYNDFETSSTLPPITTKLTTIPTSSSTTTNALTNPTHKSETPIPKNILKVVKTTVSPQNLIHQNKTKVTKSTTYISSKKTPSTENLVRSSSTLISNRSGTVPPVTLVDHESWENIVQVAPGMAELLNKPIPYDIHKKTNYNVRGNATAWSSLNGTYRKTLLERKKREIHGISIENARPRNLTTTRRTEPTTDVPYNALDIQDFLRMVEVQDDDMHGGRIALRYLRQFVGPTLYNICSDAQPYSRHVYLFNSSRIVLALNNFTLDSMSVILTGAITLYNGELRCPESQLECQVSGARVCVDSLAACDGVPNCGSYDIYDEDRLMCGAVKGLQHNVYLAAFTFLALVLTLFYGVHYWLKRCIPKVADAFFVFMDGIENILYLDTIMRHPGDTDESSKMFYHGNMFSGATEELMEEPHKNCCSRLFRKYFAFCFRKKKVKKEEEEEETELETFNQTRLCKTYSFTQMEICKMLAKCTTVETSVQTSDSLEMTLQEDNSFQITRKRRLINRELTLHTENEEKDVKTKVPAIMINDSLITLDEPLPEDELSLMKFFRDSRSLSSESMIKERIQETKIDFETGAAPSGEREISNYMYDRGIQVNPGPSGTIPKPKAKADPKVQSHTRDTRKQLRFDDVTTTIPSKEISDDEDQEEDDVLSGHRNILSMGTRTWRNQNLGTINEDEEQGSSKPRHFWESKGKKTKKKTNVSLR